MTWFKLAHCPGRTEHSINYGYFTTRDKEQGSVLVTIWVDRNNLNCNGPLPVSRAFCSNTLRAPLDSCDTDAENGKNGGILLHDCLFFVLDPSSKENQPYGFGIFDRP